MNELTTNSYQVPTAKSGNATKGEGILQFDRFSLWGVLSLSILTLGLYPIYWLYTRTQYVNANHKDKISMTLLHILFATALISFCLGFARGNETMVIVSLIADLTYYVIVLVALFQLRVRLEDIMAEGRTTRLYVSIPLTFLFSVIYLQYKINERIDEYRVDAKKNIMNSNSTGLDYSV